MRKSDFEKVPVEKLRWSCGTDSLPFETTEEISFAESILGQNRALKAIQMGLDMESVGYNVFVTGIAGTGRATSVRHLLAKKREKGAIPEDKLYVNNFRNPDSPMAISLPAGQGRSFRKDMHHLISHIRKQIPLIFESDQYAQKKRDIVDTHTKKEQTTISDFEKRMNKEGFALVQLQMGPVTKPDLLPLLEGSPVPFEKMKALVEEGKLDEKTVKQLQKKYTELIKELEDIFKQVNRDQRALRQRIQEIDAQFARDVIEPAVVDLKEHYKTPEVECYLDGVQDHIMEELDLFRGKSESASEMLGTEPAADPFLEYQVNLVVDNAELKGAPVIFEASPTYKNLFGTIERVMDRKGQWRTDFTKIKVGSFLRANGGYLVINALDALVEAGVWQTLKRTLRNRQLEIQSYDPVFMLATSALKPEPISTNVKVVMIGDPYIYQLLYYQDDDFKKIFKIRADFDDVMKKEKPNILQYATFIKKICDDEKLLPVDKTAVAAIVEYGVRLGGRQNKLSTRFNYVADLVREANYWARQKKQKVVSSEHVHKALEEKVERVSLIEDKIREMIGEGTIMIDTEGEKVGQVNGLSVVDLGDYSFGHPSRITAQTAMGRSGIISIEREVEMSGPTHDKGVLILAGYLRGKYAQSKPLSMSASVCFEQSYSSVDGDSASSTEIYALLSSLSGLPIRQDVAVTGSANQNGEIQPIGGVNEKIEGFYRVCKVKGLTGTQGVMIPRLNVDDLMLHTEIVEAVKNGKFYVYPVDNIDQGIEILTGVKAGACDQTGQFPEGTVNAIVDKKLTELAEGLRDYVGEETD